MKPSKKPEEQSRTLDFGGDDVEPGRQKVGVASKSWQAGLAAFAEERWADAARLFSAAYKEGADPQACLRGMGVALYQLEEWDKAEKVFTGGLRLFPTDTSLRFNYSLLLQELGRNQEALTEFKEVLRQEPGHPGANSILGGVTATQFRPDFGLHLLRSGYSQQVEQTFYRFALPEFSVAGPDLFTTTWAKEFDGSEYAVSIDFNGAILQQIVQLLRASHGCRHQSRVQRWCQHRRHLPTGRTGGTDHHRPPGRAATGTEGRIRSACD